MKNELLFAIKSCSDTDLIKYIEEFPGMKHMFDLELCIRYLKNIERNLHEVIESYNSMRIVCNDSEDFQSYVESELEMINVLLNNSEVIKKFQDEELQRYSDFGLDGIKLN